MLMSCVVDELDISLRCYYIFKVTGCWGFVSFLRLPACSVWALAGVGAAPLLLCNSPWLSPSKRHPTALAAFASPLLDTGWGRMCSRHHMEGAVNVLFCLELLYFDLRLISQAVH